MITLDLHGKHNKYLIRGLGANLIVISICCIFWVFGIFIIVAITVGGFKYYFSHKNLLYVRKNKKNDDKKEDSDLS